MWYERGVGGTIYCIIGFEEQSIATAGKVVQCHA